MAGSHCAGAPVLVVCEFCPPPWHEELGIDIAGHGGVCNDSVGGSDWARLLAAVRGRGPATAPPLPGLMLHGVEGGGRACSAAVPPRCTDGAVDVHRILPGGFAVD